MNRAILQHCFFWFGNTGEDAAIAILLQTLKRFSCDGAVDWNTTCLLNVQILGKANKRSVVAAGTGKHKKHRVCRDAGHVSELGDFATLFFLVRQHWGGCHYRHFAANFKAF